MIIIRGSKIQLIFFSIVPLKYLVQAISVEGLSVTPHCTWVKRVTPVGEKITNLNKWKFFRPQLPLTGVKLFHVLVSVLGKKNLRISAGVFT